jgi:outer membrane receptor for ferrienterochelin and colicin
MSIRLTFIALLIFSFSFGQSKGTIKGIITDKEANNAPLPFANATIKGTSINTTTNEKGEYILKIEPGVYKIEFSFIGYENVEVPVTVKDGAIVEVNISLGSGGYQLKDVVIQNVRRKNTESALVLEMKEAKQIISAISAEQMSKGTDGNAAQAIQRVPGVTINDGKFVMVRGLNERYNNVMINNSLAPSTEVDRRTFSFDLLPTNALEKMTISKTGAAYLPGDFAGGLVNVTTSENFNEFTQLSFNVGFRNNTTFNDFYETKGSKTDFLGFDNGFRQLPSGFPTSSNVLNDNDQSVFYANQLSNNFNPNQSTAFLDSGIGFSLGRKINFKSGKVLRTVNALSYSNRFQSYLKNTNTYINSLVGEQTSSQLQRDFEDNYFSNEVRLTLLSNWSLKLNDNNKITFKNLYNQIGDSYSTLRTGEDFDQRPDQDLQNYEFGYSGRRIYTGQFNGNHDFPKNKNLQWVLGGNLINDILPDLRRFRTFRAQNSSPIDPFIMIDPPSSNPFDTGRFYSELNEYSVNGGLDFKKEFERVKNDEELANIVFKTGVFADYKTRDFSARYFSYVIPGTVASDRREELVRLPLSEVFSPVNVNASNGWVFREGSNLSDSYQASNMLMAGYVYGEVPISKILLTGGIRIEHNVLDLDGFESITAVNVNQPITTVLPSLNFSYNINEKNLLRLAYSRTVNRPEFREIAPFNFYNFQLDSNVLGNKALTTATIDNFDLRYELYPEKGETFSLGLFYKNFDKPIENSLFVQTQQRAFTFVNSTSAIVYGAEIEIRKSLKNVFKEGFFSDLAVNVNASYIFSEVDLGDATNDLFSKRQLQGQSPYVINAALGYDNKDNGWSSNIIYNRFGDRIFSIGNQIFPAIYELARNQLDFTISKSIKKMSLKLGISNILDDKFRFFQDTNSDNKINKNNDAPVFIHQTGALYNLTVTYKL